MTMRTNRPDLLPRVGRGGMHRGGRDAVHRHGRSRPLHAAKDGEIAAAIGPHQAGSVDVTNLWGNNSCRWVAKNAPAVKAPEGWRDSIEVGVFEGSMSSWARDKAHGTPIDGVAKSAARDRISAEAVVGECAGGRMCVVKLDTADSK